MSLDTYPARPLSPITAQATVSAWASLRRQMDAKRAAEAAALRQELGNPIRPKTAEELRADITRFNDWLQETTISSNGALADWIRGQKAASIRRLAQLTLDGAA